MIRDFPVSAWRRIRIDVPTRKYPTIRVWEKQVTLAGCRLPHPLYVLNLGHDRPTVLLTNDTRTPKTLITRHAQRMLIENATCDAAHFCEPLLCGESMWPRGLRVVLGYPASNPCVTHPLRNAKLINPSRFVDHPAGGITMDGLSGLGPDSAAVGNHSTAGASNSAGTFSLDRVCTPAQCT